MNVDFGGMAATLAFSPEQRLEAWSISIGQCATTLAVAALEDRLHRRLDMLRNREAPCGVERSALQVCAQRRAELIAEAAPAAPPSAPGGTPASQEAHGPSAMAMKEFHQW